MRSASFRFSGNARTTIMANLSNKTEQVGKPSRPVPPANAAFLSCRSDALEYVLKTQFLAIQGVEFNWGQT